MNETANTSMLKARVSNKGLCPACSTMLSAPGFKDMCSESGYKHHKATDIKSNADQGCQLCAILETQIWHTTTFPPSLRRHLSSTKAFVFHLCNGPSRAGLTVSMNQDDATITTPKFDRLRPSLANVPLQSLDLLVMSFKGWLTRNHASPLTAVENPASKYVTARPIVSDLASQRVIDHAKAWIFECKTRSGTGHCSCHFPDTHQLPTRVLDVGNAIGDLVKLVITASSVKNAEYVALSYCWGGDQPLKLLTSTINKLQNGLKVSDLPQTIRDSIEVTRRLGFRYLWIDALCIIQDSGADKSEEIQRMGAIYKNATVTIAAGVGSSVSEGFLRIPRYVHPSLDVEMELPNGETLSVSIAAQESTPIPALPLNERGWTLQEYLLSPRILTFSDRELVWHCQSKRFETMSMRGGHDPLYFAERLPDEVFHCKHGKDRSQEDLAERHALWRDIVQNFCQRSLTDKEDRLNALTGISNELSAVWQDQCVSGLWRRNILTQLLWQVSFGEHEHRHKRSDRAPSWSWASVDAPIIFHAQCNNFIAVTQEMLHNLPTQSEIRLRCKILEFSEICQPSLMETIDVLEDTDLNEQSKVLLLTSSIEKGGNFGYGGADAIRYDGVKVIRIERPDNSLVFRRIGSAMLWAEPADALNALVSLRHLSLITLL